MTLCLDDVLMLDNTILWVLRVHRKSFLHTEGAKMLGNILKYGIWGAILGFLLYFVAVGLEWMYYGLVEIIQGIEWHVNPVLTILMVVGAVFGVLVGIFERYGDFS